MWKLNNTLLNNQEITGEIKEEIKKYLETILPQETRNISNKQPNLTPKESNQRKKNKENPKSLEGKKS